MKILSRHYFLALVLILLENLILYQDYWFGGSGFARDFAVTYHAMPYYWILKAVHSGFSQWVPTVAMGYPIQLDPQSALFYPFLWIFVVLKIPYSLGAAIKLQLIHIALGSLGVFALTKSLKFDFRIALFCALCFQMIGGFSHASHDPDIIRGYALYPWLLFSLLYNGRLIVSVVMIPLIFYLFATGVYPGNVIALFFTTSFFLLLYILLDKKMSRREKIYTLLLKLFLASLGILMSSVWLLPIIMNKSELSRMNVDMVFMKRHFYKLENFFTLAFNANTPSLEKSQDITMRSLFVGCGVLFPIFFVDLKRFVTLIPWVFIISFAWALGCGEYFYFYVGKMFPPLFFSRFLTSDYLPAIIVPVFILSAMGLKNISNHTLSRKRIVLSFLALLVLYFYGLKVMQVDFSDKFTNYLGVSSWVLLLMIFGFLFWKKNLNSIFFGIVLIGLFFSNVLSFFRAVDSNHMFWRIDNYDTWYIQKTKFDTKTFSPLLIDQVSKPLKERPARIFNGNDSFFWRGWLSGDYSMIDYGITLRRSMEILTGGDQELIDFMMRPSSGYLIDKPKETSFYSLLKAQKTSCGRINYKKYSSEELLINISSENECLFYHNELYFPGWEATILYRDGRVSELRPSAVANGLIRSYLLPKGDYILREKFTIPGFSLGIWISLISLFFWFLIILWNLMRNNKGVTHAEYFNNN